MARLETARSAASGGDGWESHSRLHAFVPASIQGRRGAPWWATGRTPPGVKPLTNALARLLLTVREDRAGLDVGQRRGHVVGVDGRVSALPLNWAASAFLRLRIGRSDRRCRLRARGLGGMAAPRGATLDRLADVVPERLDRSGVPNNSPAEAFAAAASYIRVAEDGCEATAGAVLADNVGPQSGFAERPGPEKQVRIPAKAGPSHRVCRRGGEA